MEKLVPVRWTHASSCVARRGRNEDHLEHVVPAVPRSVEEFNGEESHPRKPRDGSGFVWIVLYVKRANLCFLWCCGSLPSCAVAIILLSFLAYHTSWSILSKVIRVTEASSTVVLVSALTRCKIRSWS